MNNQKSNVTGCALLFLVALLLSVALLWAFSTAADSASRQTDARANLEYARGQAQAMVIEAQAESRLHSAQAWAITAAAIIPFLALAIVGLLGLAIVALSIALTFRPKQPEQVQVLYLPPPQVPRREIWQAMVEIREALLVEGRKE